jgi:hypothetical protein
MMPEEEKKRPANKKDRKEVLRGMAHRVSEKVSSSLKDETKGEKKSPWCQSGDGLAGYACATELNDDFECSALMGAFGCISPFDCPGASFGCEGGWLDDFECTGKGRFDCKGKKFDCKYSFDDEDCKDFICDKKTGFDCKKDYN